MADDEEAELKPRRFSLNSMLIPPVYNLFPTKYPTHPNYLLYSEHTEADDEQIILAVCPAATKPGICLILGDFNAPHISWQTG